ncbi:MAG: nitrile hydratase subunit beta [Lautropia sp.]
MNGPQDLGGAQGFGPLPLEADEPVFHHPWERRAFALTLAMGATGAWNIDMSRAARESIPPARYLSLDYYAIWFEALLALMHERGLVDASALGLPVPPAPASAPASAAPATPALRVLDAARVQAVLAAGSPTARAADASAPSPRFVPGQRVRARRMNPAGHTRLPRYVRGCVGVIEASHGAHVFPDRHAIDGVEAPQPLYTVRFAATSLWGDDTTADAVHVDCWESYLDAAE